MKLLAQHIIALGASLFMTSACSSITAGSIQSVTINTDPQGAKCQIKREGIVVGYVNPTPNSVTVEKSKYDLSILCTKDGYEPSAQMLPSKLEDMTFGNVLFGGLIGVGVDAATGAINEYPNMITIPLTPQNTNSFHPPRKKTEPIDNFSHI